MSAAARGAGAMLATAVCSFAVFAVTAIVFGMVFVREIDKKAQPDLWIERTLAGQFAGCMALLIFAWFVPPRAHWRIDLRTAVRTIAGYLGFLVPWVLFVVAYTWAMQMLDYPVTAQDHLQYFVRPHGLTPAFALVLLTVCVIGPIAEEVVFRGHLTDALVATFGVAVGNLLSAILFGLLHGAAIAAPLALLGLLFQRLRHIHGSLAPPVLAHILHNTITVGLAMLDPKLLEALQR